MDSRRCGCKRNNYLFEIQEKVGNYWTEMSKILTRENGKHGER